MIQWVYDRGLAELVYYGFQGVGAVITVAFLLVYCKKLDMKPWQALVIMLCVYPVAVLLSNFLSWAEGGFRQMRGLSIMRAFVYVPLIGWPVAKLLKLSWSKLCDLVAPCLCLCVGISQIGCIFTGCCAGYACSWGIYNPLSGQRLFPIQLVEVAALLCIAVALVYRAYKNQFRCDGRSYPVMLMLVGSMRFILEFARDNRKVWLGCSSIALHGLFMAVVGLDAFYTVWEHIQKKQQSANLTKRRNKK